MKYVVWPLCVVLALLPTLAEAQTPTTPTEDVMTSTFTHASNAAKQLSDACPTAACLAAVENLTQLVSDGKAKHERNELATSVARKEYWHSLVDATDKAIDAARAYQKESEAAAKQPNPPKPAAAFTQQQCQLCETVFKISLALCAVYNFEGCHICAALCVLIAARAYFRCEEAYCV